MEQKTIEQQVAELESDTPISSLTVGQFIELIGHVGHKKRLAALEAELKQRIAEHAEIATASAGVFADAKKLTHATSPFRISTRKALDEFYDSLKYVVDEGTGAGVLLSMAIEGPADALPASTKTGR